jgi:hypothetical protein
MSTAPALADLRARFLEYRQLAERALERLGDEDFFRSLDWESNSPALLVKHVAGNLRSRFTDFLTTDGDKPDRRRDLEFQREPDDTRESLMAAWQAAWARLGEALDSLGEDDLARQVTIRGEPYSVGNALHRSLAHTAYHVGQLVLLAKHYAAGSWSSLSIPRGASEPYTKEIRDKFSGA